jgi:hypothetical protein
MALVQILLQYVFWNSFLGKIFNNQSIFTFSFLCMVDCSEKTRMLLTSAAFVHLKHADFSKHTRNLSPASRAILLSGPAG